MAETITITIPDSPIEREELFQLLATRGLLPASVAVKKKGKFAELARQYREENILTGHGETVTRLRKEFREDFIL